eukprot:1161193-Pelagomonas_calceolata.AAC.6
MSKGFQGRDAPNNLWRWALTEEDRSVATINNSVFPRCLFNYEMHASQAEKFVGAHNPESKRKAFRTDFPQSVLQTDG